MTWKEALKDLKASSAFKNVLSDVVRLSNMRTVYPPKKDWFRALELTPLDQVKVVILGQDPYHQPKQANGLAFSVFKDVALPPSLRNIYKELYADLGISNVDHGDLNLWALEGVLLLNTTLTVEDSMPLSHKDIGWEMVTDKVIEVVSKQCDAVVFMLWGKHAQGKENLIDQRKHLVLKAPHPSPLSAYRGFFGCRHFSKGNAFLRARGKGPVNYQL